MPEGSARERDRRSVHADCFGRGSALDDQQIVALAAIGEQSTRWQRIAVAQIDGKCVVEPAAAEHEVGGVNFGDVIVWRGGDRWIVVLPDMHPIAAWGI